MHDSRAAVKNGELDYKFIKLGFQPQLSSDGERSSNSFQNDSDSQSCYRYELWTMRMRMERRSLRGEKSTWDFKLSSLRIADGPEQAQAAQ